MRVLTAQQMRDIDRRTSERGIPSLILMENAGLRVVEAMQQYGPPLASQDVLVVCGKGNNGGDGLVVARQLLTRKLCQSVRVLLTQVPNETTGDVAENRRMWEAAGGTTERQWTPELRRATVVVDAILGTGLKGPVNGIPQQAIQTIQREVRPRWIVAVDLPSGMASDAADTEGDCLTANLTVTFTAPRVAHALAPNVHRMGKIVVAPIGTPAAMLDEVPGPALHLTEAADLKPLFAPRRSDSNKGTYGHVLVIAGARGKTGAAAMCGMAALRAGAGLVTVASATSAIPVIAGHCPELMTEALAETPSGAVALRNWEDGTLQQLIERRTVVAVGPGLGQEPETVECVRRLVEQTGLPMVIDADALNALAGHEWHAGPHVRILTPHPGEMSRLVGKTVKVVQAARLETVRAYAQEHGAHVLLKGERSLIANAQGDVFVNPTGSPALAKGGTGDVLTGMIAGLLAQHAEQPADAARAAAYWHGLAGEVAAERWGESSVLATDLLAALPEALERAVPWRHRGAREHA